MPTTQSSWKPVSAVLLAFVALGLTLASSATGTTKNPLAGNWTGTTTEGNSVSFTITKKGKVLNFAGVVNVACAGKQETVTPPGPIKLTKPVPGYPKGKKFEYQGPGGNPPVADVFLKGKADTTKQISGAIEANAVPTPTGGTCKSPKVTYSAHKAKSGY